MDELEINRLLKTFYNKKVYIAMIILFFIFAGYVYSYYYVTPKYKSETTIILIKNTGETSANEITQSDISLNQKLVSTYGEIIKSNKVLREVINNLGLDLTENKLYNLIKVKDVSNTEILKITVINEDPMQAKNIANEVAKVFSKEVMSLYKIDNVNVIDEAEEELIPYNINHVKDIAIFTVIGIGVSICFIFLLYYFDSTIKEETDVEAYVGVNLLTTIPMHQRYMKNSKKFQEHEDSLEELVTYEDYKSPISEFFRTLRTNIMFTQTKDNIRTILVTSGMMGEGKSWVTANLATAFAQSNKSVLLIDSDMRKGRQHHIFKVSNKYGFSNCLVMKNEEVEDINNFKPYIQETKIENLHIITSGNRPPNPSELLSSSKVSKIIDTLQQIYDIIIFDGTPCMLVSDSIILSNMMDTSIIVAEYRKSKIENTKKLKKSIENAGGTIGGLVLNKLPISVKAYKSKYYYGDKRDSSIQEKIDDIKYGETKTVDELIEKARIKSMPETVEENQIPNEPTIEDKIEKLENMIEKYIISNNELMKNNMDKVEELKSTISKVSEERLLEKKTAKKSNSKKKTESSKSKENKEKKNVIKKRTTIKPQDEVTKIEESQNEEITSKNQASIKQEIIKKKNNEKILNEEVLDKKDNINNQEVIKKEIIKKVVIRKEPELKEESEVESQEKTTSGRTNILKFIIGDNKKAKTETEEEETPVSQILRM